MKKGFEVLYLVEPTDEHTIQNLPDFDSKKFQNAAKVMMKYSYYLYYTISDTNKPKTVVTRQQLKCTDMAGQMHSVQVMGVVSTERYICIASVL